MRTKTQASIDLHITDRKRQRVCEKLHDDLISLGYEKNGKYINDDCFAILKAYIESENEVKDYIRIVSKHSIARRLNISTKTLSNWMHKPRIFDKLVAVGYSKNKKKLTKREYEILAKHLDL